MSEFLPQVSKLTLVADPDGLLTEEKLVIQLLERGFEIIEFTDSIQFRYAYESRYRAIWDRGENTDLVVVLRTIDAEANLNKLPYDLLKAGRKLSFNLGDIFPKLSYPVLEKLDRELLDKLYGAQLKSPPDQMGDNATKDYILLHVYEIASSLISTEEKLISTLMRTHYKLQCLPQVFVDRLIQLLDKESTFASWPLQEIIHDSSYFYGFLQERWPLYLSKLGQTEDQTWDSPAKYGLKYPGPVQLPFENEDIKIYLDNLFFEGKLQQIADNNYSLPANSWARVGIIAKDKTSRLEQVSKFFDLIEKELKQERFNHKDWLIFANSWAQLSALVHCEEDPDNQHRLRILSLSINQEFLNWMNKNYASLITLPFKNLAMLHHVPRNMASHLRSCPKTKVALVVLDGLSLDQWVTMRNTFRRQNSTLTIRESATFAWVPTLTSVSRQALFAGATPRNFPNSIKTTSKEEKLWKKFWEGEAINRKDVAYFKGLGDGEPSQDLSSVHFGKTRVLGLVVDKVDRIMHGMELGSAGMHSQIKQWCQSGYVHRLLTYLVEHNFDIWLTSDHGNIQSEGKGQPKEGACAETRGERVRVYPSTELRDHVAQSFQFASKWQPVNLPENYHPLVATGHDAFVNEGTSLVGHGGVSIEEVIVPLVYFQGRSA